MEDIRFIDYFKWVGISFLVVFSFVFLGGYHIGPLSARLIVAYGLLGYVLWRGRTEYAPTMDMKMYFNYLIVYLFISLLNFSAFSVSFVKGLIAVHFVCCIAIYAFPRIFKNEVSIRAALIVLAFGFLLNAFVTFLQALNIPLGWSIGMFINPTDIADMEEMQMELEDTDQLEKSFIMGIMGKSVGNGYFIATLLPVMTYYIWDKFRVKTLWTYFMFTVAALCIFFIQQRMALLVFLIYILYIGIRKKISPMASILIFATIIIFLAVYLEDILYFDYSQLGRLTSTRDSVRNNTLTVLEDFIDNPLYLLLGHNQKTTAEGYFIFHTMGHNSFLDSLRMGGIFLFITYIVLFVYLCKNLINLVQFSHDEKDFRTLGLALGCLCYLLYSQTHSTGVQSGSIIFWVLYMLTIQSHRVWCESNNEEENSIEDENEESIEMSKS